jgi:hypothetical protein
MELQPLSPSLKFKSINEIQRKHIVEKVNFENRLLFER